MTPERAIEILDPEHREHYDSIEVVEEACRLGIKAIKKCMIPQKMIKQNYSNTAFYKCPTCNFANGVMYNYCPNCGQAIDWGYEQ